jgi:hypothetical protein
MNRRTLVAGLLATTALTACATTLDTNMKNAALDAKILADGLAGIQTQLGMLNIPALTPAVMNTVSDVVKGVQAEAAAMLNYTATKSSITSDVQNIEGYVNQFFGAITPAVLALIPPPISTAITAIAVLLPVIEAAVNLILPQASRTAAIRNGTTMNVGEARLQLRMAALSK